MAIQVRRGNHADFDPNKMLPGEWAVSIDADTEKQVVWMCFAAGIVKRMGAYEDIRERTTEIVEELNEEYLVKFNEMLTQIETYASETKTNTDAVIQIHNEIENTYFPQMKQYHAESKSSAEIATEKAVAAKASASEAEVSATRAEQVAASAGWADFDINEQGHLIFTKTDNLETEFALTENGRLEVTLV